MGRHLTRYPAEVRERAVRLVFEHRGEYGSRKTTGAAATCVPERSAAGRRPLGPKDCGVTIISSAPTASGGHRPMRR